MRNESSGVSLAQQAYLNQIKHASFRIQVMRIFLFIAFLALWELSAQMHWINDFIFCSPSKTVSCFLDLLLHNRLLSHIAVTTYETILGFVLVTLLSLIIAILLWWSETLSKVLEPYLVVLNSLPKSALAPLLIVWLGGNKTTIIVCAISVAIFGSILNLYTTFRLVDPDTIKLIVTLKGTKFDVLRLVVIPSSIPGILSTMKVNIGLCLVGVVIGEFLAAKEGLGYLIIYGSQTFKMSWVIMSILVLCILAMLLYHIMKEIEKRLTRFMP